MSEIRHSCAFCAKRGYESCPHPQHDASGCEAFEDVGLWYSRQVALLERSLHRIIIGAAVVAVVLLGGIAGDLFLHLHLHGAVMEQLRHYPVPGRI